MYILQSIYKANNTKLIKIINQYKYTIYKMESHFTIANKIKELICVRIKNIFN